MLKKAAFRVFSSFIYSDYSEISFSKFSLLKPSSSIRIIAEYNSDPSVLKRFLHFQKQTNLQTSSFIEICRFLSLFPDFRIEMLCELEFFSTKSVYNSYILYMFHFILNSITSDKIPDDSLNRIEYFYTNFISHSYLYWNSRKQKKYLRSFFESFFCAYLANEEKNLIHGLLRIYPKNDLLHKYYAEMLLNIDGEFKLYKKEMMFSIKLKNNNNSVIDPLLYYYTKHAMSLQNPKILQFCNSELQLSIYYSNSSSEFASNKSSSIFKKKKKIHLKKKDIASKIVRSRRKIPYFHVLNYILPTLIILAFSIYVDVMHYKDVKKSKNLEKSIESIDQSFNIIASSVFIPLSLRNFTSNQTTDEFLCQQIFFSITRVVSNYLYSPIISDFDDSIVNSVFHELKKLVFISSDVCFIVNNFHSFLKKTVFENVALIHEQESSFTLDFEEIYQNEENLFNISYFIVIGSVFIIIFLVIYFIVTCVTINSIMAKNERAIEYLSSNRRLIQFFQKQEFRDSLWYNANGIESSMNNSDSSFRLDYESEFETTSHFSTSTQNSKKSVSYQPKTQNIRPTSSATHIMKNQLISPSSIKFNKNGEIETNDSFETKKQRISLSKSSLSGSETNFASKKNLIPRPNNIRKNYETENSLASDTMNFDASNKNTDESENELNLNVDNIYENDYETALQLSNDNAISELLSNKKKDTIKFSFYTIIFIILFPWILFYLIVSLCFSPLKFRRKSDFEIVGKLQLYLKDFKNAFSLLDETLNLLENEVINYSQLLAVNESFSLRKTELSDLYFEVQCFRFENIECSSVCSLVGQLYINNCSNIYIDMFAIPFLVNFTKTSIQKLFVYYLQQIFTISSPSFSFLFLEFCFGIAFIITGVIKSKNLRDGLNSLFHFPAKEFTVPQNETKTEISSQNNSEINISNAGNNLNLSKNNKTSSSNNNNSNEKMLKNDNTNINSINMNDTSNLKIFNDNDVNNSTTDPLQQSNNNNNDNDNSNSTAKIQQKNSQNFNLSLNFPENNNHHLHHENAIPQSPKAKLFPSNVMIVTSVTETDEIYSISDTCNQIIGRSPSELICRKFSRIFPLTKTADGFETRDYGGKTFISKTKTIGKLSKTVLIEISKMKAKNIATNVFQKLVNFMPYFFVKPFTDEFVDFFHFERSVLIFVRINPMNPQIDNFFNTLGRIDQSFFNVDLIRSNGSILDFICSKFDPLEVVLFIRDLIVSGEESAKRSAANYALKSIFVCEIDQLNAQIVEGDIEPEIHFEENAFFKLECFTYFVDDMNIGCSDGILSMLNSIGNFKNIVSKNNINLIQFKDFNDEMANIL